MLNLWRKLLSCYMDWNASPTQWNPVVM